jgi:hypothetical protein
LYKSSISCILEKKSFPGCFYWQSAVFPSGSSALCSLRLIGTY